MFPSLLQTKFVDPRGWSNVLAMELVRVFFCPYLERVIKIEFTICSTFWVLKHTLFFQTEFSLSHPVVLAGLNSVCSLIQASLSVTELCLPLPPERQDWRCAPPHSVQTGFYLSIGAHWVVIARSHCRGFIVSCLWKGFIEGEGTGMGTWSGYNEPLSPPASAVPCQIQVHFPYVVVVLVLVSIWKAETVVKRICT